MKSKSIDFFKFCPRCAGKLRKKKREHARQLVCSKCGFVFYQNSKPTVSAIIVNNRNQILLVERGIKPRLGYWDLPGGFLEEAEDPIVGLKREIKEELGVSITINHLIGAYIDMYFERYSIYTLNIAYEVKILSGKMKPMSDITSLRWFNKMQVPNSRLAFNWMKPALKDWLKK